VVQGGSADYGGSSSPKTDGPQECSSSGESSGGDGHTTSGAEHDALKLAPACAPFKRFNTAPCHHPKAALGDATNVAVEGENFIDERSEDFVTAF
jgi:hypothetical protein